MNYDANLMEYVSAKSIRPGISIVASTNKQAGKIRFIAASEGADKGISGNTPLLTLEFKAKDVQETKYGTISVTNVTLGDDEGKETKAVASSISIQITPKPTGVPGDVNGDGKVTIGDLGFAAANYGKDSKSPDWQLIKAADINGDNIIDINDLAAIARILIQ